MTFFPSSELLLDPSPMRVDGTLPGQLAKATARGAMLARTANPAPFIARPRAPGLAGLGLSLAWEAWNEFGGAPTPIPITGMNFPQGVITSSFTIRVTSTWLDNQIPPGVTFTDTSPVRTVPGTLINVEIGSNEAGFVGVFATVRNPDGTVVRIAVSNATRDPARFRVISIDNVEVVPQGQTQNAPATYPFTVPQALLPANPDVPLNLAIPRIPNITPVPLIIPIIIPSPSDLARNPIPIVYPISIPEDQRRALPQMWITPEGIQVGRGTRGDPIIVTIGDSTSSSTNINTQTDYDIRNPPTTVTCNEDPPPGGDCCSCDDIRQIVFEELDSKIPPKRPTADGSFSTPAAESGSITLPSFTTSVTLQMVVPGISVPDQFGGLDAPNVVYNGWYSYGVEEVTSERIPFNYDFISVPIPPGVRFFSYTITRGGTATATVRHIIPSP